MTYNAIQGDVWDLISFKVYGDEGFVDTLIKANPHLRQIVMFDGSETVSIPDKPTVKPASLETLPPWKQ